MRRPRRLRRMLFACAASSRSHIFPKTGCGKMWERRMPENRILPDEKSALVKDGALFGLPANGRLLAHRGCRKNRPHPARRLDGDMRAAFGLPHCLLAHRGCRKDRPHPVRRLGRGFARGVWLAVLSPRIAAAGRAVRIPRTGWTGICAACFSFPVRANQEERRGRLQRGRPPQPSCARANQARVRARSACSCAVSAATEEKRRSGRRNARYVTSARRP